MTINIFSWNEHSEGAKELAREMGIKRIRHENSKYKGSQRKYVINWGSSQVPDELRKSNLLNKPENILLASNKLKFFETLSEKEINIPDWTNDLNVAVRWVSEGYKVCARTILSGHSAAGLVIMHKDDLESLKVKAPLYTKYIPKKDEYRVHVVNGSVIDVQRKALRNGWVDEHGPDVNYQVRNLANGFVYVRQNVDAPKGVTDQALIAMGIIGLDFGAVDVIWNEKQKKAYVLEINSAPGLEGTSIENYAKAFESIGK